MKSKLLIVAFIAVLLCSAFSIASTMAQCPTCDGTGEIECSYCDGAGEITVEEGQPCEHCSGTGTLEPILIQRSRSHWLSDGKMYFSVSYKIMRTSTFTEGLPQRWKSMITLIPPPHHALYSQQMKTPKFL